MYDACGPDRIEFGALIRHNGDLTGGRARPLRLPIRAWAPLYAGASRVMRETILATDELTDLSRNRLDSLEAPAGQTGLLAWLEEHASAIGRRFAREPRQQPR